MRRPPRCAGHHDAPAREFGVFILRRQKGLQGVQRSDDALWYTVEIQCSADLARRLLNPCSTAAERADHQKG
jgi:hypothetical protein